MSRRETIKAVVSEMVEEAAGEPRDFDDTELLVDQLGLRSLHLARITALLEVELDLDPFAELVPITGIRTVEDLYRAYDLAADPPAGGSGAPDAAPAAPGAAPAAPGTTPLPPATTAREAALRARELRTRARGGQE
ncbi:hypothetical protein ACFTTN_23885 [Streptomyces niveus]|uniref:hypothetical protein n=1 Tax=Streptomyces niveus TaxID=193462 RepID=UPI00363FC31C